MKASSAIIGTVVGVMVLIAAVLALRWVLAPATGAVQQREMTVGKGAYRIAAYEQFYEECNSAKTVQQNLATAIQAAQAGNADPMRQAQLDANVTALTNQLHDAVNTYNAHAAEVDTRAHFLASDLPFELAVGQADPTMPAISCTAH